MVGEGLRPSVIWAALQMASKDADGNRHSVLVYITQMPENLARAALRLIRDQWGPPEIPDYFTRPTEESDYRAWERCLNACADYFGEGSDEHQLLLRGIILHRGKMPGRIARQFVGLIERRIIHVVLATYTLAEGVNLPFETVIIPSLGRGKPTIPVAEFLNVAGRAGRPGSSTEGRCLVAWDASDPQSSTRWRYNTLLTRLAERSAEGELTSLTQSALAALLQFIQSEWRRVSGSSDWSEFLEWLETVAPLQEGTGASSTSSRTPADAVDSLDAFLIAAIEDAHGGAVAGGVEREDEDLDLAAVEERITRVWQRTFARFAAEEQGPLQEMVLRRGRGIVTRIYPDRRLRRQYYMSSLPPKHAREVTEAFPVLRDHLEAGREFAIWTPAERLEYFVKAAEVVDGLAKFRFSRRRFDPEWRAVLHWWLHHESAPSSPSRSKVSQWLKYVDDNFVVRFTWGLGSMMALAAEERPPSGAQPLSAEAWESVGFPWVAFWMKDMLTWGTLEAPAAYLLTSQIAATRREAQELAREYAASVDAGDWGMSSPDERLNALNIREWAEGLRVSVIPEEGVRPPHEVPVVVERDFSGTARTFWRVLPVERGDSLDWCDPAGFVLASSARPDDWLPPFLNSYDAVLDVTAKVVRTYSYRRADKGAIAG